MSFPRQPTAAEMARYNAGRAQAQAARVHPTGQGRSGSMIANRVDGQAVMAQFRARRAMGWDHDFYPKSGTGAFEESQVRSAMGIAILIGGLYLLFRKP